MLLQLAGVILMGAGFVLVMGLIAYFIGFINRCRYQREAVLPPPSKLCERRQPEAVGRVE